MLDSSCVDERGLVSDNICAYDGNEAHKGSKLDHRASV